MTILIGKLPLGTQEFRLLGNAWTEWGEAWDRYLLAPESEELKATLRTQAAALEGLADALSARLSTSFKDCEEDGFDSAGGLQRGPLPAT